jgi:hypothetical protein
VLVYLWLLHPWQESARFTGSFTAAVASGDDVFDREWIGRETGLTQAILAAAAGAIGQQPPLAGREAWFRHWIRG